MIDMIPSHNTRTWRMQHKMQTQNHSPCEVFSTCDDELADSLTESASGMLGDARRGLCEKDEAAEPGLEGRGSYVGRVSKSIEDANESE